MDGDATVYDDTSIRQHPMAWSYTELGLSPALESIVQLADGKSEDANDTHTRDPTIARRMTARKL